MYHLLLMVVSVNPKILTTSWICKKKERKKEIRNAINVGGNIRNWAYSSKKPNMGNGLNGSSNFISQYTHSSD